MSTIRTSTWCAGADVRRRARPRRVGPALLLTRWAPARTAQMSSWSAAAARKVSAPAMLTVSSLPASGGELGDRVVLPEPLTPTTMITPRPSSGRDRRESGPKIATISSRRSASASASRDQRARTRSTSSVLPWDRHRPSAGCRGGPAIHPRRHPWTTGIGHGPPAARDARAMALRPREGNLGLRPTPEPLGLLPSGREAEEDESQGDTDEHDGDDELHAWTLAHRLCLRHVHAVSGAVARSPRDVGGEVVAGARAVGRGSSWCRPC